MCNDRLSCRPAEEGDREAINTILVDTFDSYRIDLPENYSFADIEDFRAAYIEAHGAFMVLTRAGRLIGFFGLVPDNNGRRIHLKRLYLRAAERGKGFGNHLIHEAMRIARQMGHAAMYLETTSKFKEAVGLYKKHGFVDDPGAQPSPGHDVALLKVL